MNRKVLIQIQILLVAAVVVVPAWTVEAQVITTPGQVRISSGGAAAGFRAPGNMVSNGVARAKGFTPNPLAIIEITETEPTTSLRAQLLADSISIIFQQVNNAIYVFNNLIRARGGLPLAAPVSVSTTFTSQPTGGLDSLLDQFGGFFS